ncbi:MAG: tripartite tricarboxylate transporter substrate binding protein [Proteobacteria bacterium]|nr:tripartite tricarboxylate transporter substrate binding protein [Pseudomonadota bacterium]
MKKILASLFLALFAGLAFAQSYPAKPIRIIVAYPPGGGTDVLARLVGKFLNDSIKQSVVIENRAGANGGIGVDLVAKSPADGYTLLAIAAGPLDESNLKQFAAVSLFAAPAYTLVIHPSVNATNVKELVALAKAQPGKFAYGSTGGGAASHLAAELFKAMAGIDLLHVPYKGVGNAVTDLLGGQVQVMVAPTQSVTGHVKSGKLHALAVTGSKRLATLPEVPTLAEAGVPGYEAVGWFGLMAPVATPRDIVTMLLQLPDVKTRLLELGAEPASLSPEQFIDFIRSDNAKWEKLIKERGIVVEKSQ